MNVEIRNFMLLLHVNFYKELIVVNLIIENSIVTALLRIFKAIVIFCFISVMLIVLKDLSFIVVVQKLIVIMVNVIVVKSSY